MYDQFFDVKKLITALFIKCSEEIISSLSFSYHHMSLTDTNQIEGQVSSPTKNMIPLIFAIFQKELDRCARYNSSTIKVEYQTAGIPTSFSFRIPELKRLNTTVIINVSVFLLGSIYIANLTGSECSSNSAVKYFMLGVEWDPFTMKTDTLEEKVSLFCEYIFNGETPRVKKSLYIITTAVENAATFGKYIEGTVPENWKCQKLEDLFKDVMLTVLPNYYINNIQRHEFTFTIVLHSKLSFINANNTPQSISFIFHNDGFLEITLGTLKIICRAECFTRESMIAIQKNLC